jgi:hypothetical protein
VLQTVLDNFWSIPFPSKFFSHGHHVKIIHG